MKDIILKLNSLKKVAPTKSWKEQNRGVLMSQIAQTGETVEFSWLRTTFQKLAFSMLQQTARPTVAVFLIVIFVFGGGLISIRAAKNTAPGDSLYIAKIVSEKTQLALTFDQKEKIRLGLMFARNRAEEINKILSNENEEESGKVVAKLKDNFRKELSQARERLKNINVNQSLALEAVSQETGEEASEENQVFSANLGKDEKGISISGEDEEKTVEETIVNEEVVADEEAPTSTPETVEEATSSVSAIIDDEEKEVNPQEILDEAGVLLANQDYTAVLSKLDEAGEAIDQPDDQGEVKGENESATTTESGESE
ncbi:DUF5667 domain-containing protein, partial [bacterium]|nr:DUF5667 domain-containing protein [bacterium]